MPFYILLVNADQRWKSELGLEPMVAVDATPTLLFPEFTGEKPSVRTQIPRYPRECSTPEDIGLRPYIRVWQM